MYGNASVSPITRGVSMLWEVSEEAISAMLAIDKGYPMDWKGAHLR